jgi:hypothetical protein
MQTTLELKRIDLWSLFKVAFLLYALLGLVAGIFYALFLMIAGSLQSAFLHEGFPKLGAISGVLAIVLVPLFSIMYGAIGSVVVTIAGFLYNLFAGLVGGIRISAIVDVGPAVRTTTPAATSADDQPPTI